MKFDLYTLLTATELHVGTGSENIGIIDNPVQRDPVTDLPCIPGSGVKGAYREHFSGTEVSKFETYCFGPRSDDEGGYSGAIDFLSAYLISRPVRSDRRLYYHGTSPGVIRDQLDRFELMGVTLSGDLADALAWLAGLIPEKPLVFDGNDDAMLEEYFAVTQHPDTGYYDTLVRFFGGHVALFNDSDFRALRYPVNERIKVGKEKKDNNLWFDETVPRMSRFCMLMGTPTNLAEEDEKNILRFHERLAEGKLIHFGGHRTIGRGFCRVSKVS